MACPVACPGVSAVSSVRCSTIVRPWFWWRLATSILADGHLQGYVPPASPLPLTRSSCHPAGWRNLSGKAGCSGVLLMEFNTNDCPELSSAPLMYLGEESGNHRQPPCQLVSTSCCGVPMPYKPSGGLDRRILKSGPY